MVRRVTHREGPDPVDAHVGQRMQLRMRLTGMSQEQLAPHLNVSWQQVQKYCKAKNRMSAAQLHRAALALKVPVGWFFEGLGQSATFSDVNASQSRAMLDAVRTLSEMDAIGVQAVLTGLKRIAGKRDDADVEGVPV